MTKETIIKKIEDRAKRILPTNATLILYGSRARGDARVDSDWDLLILLDGERITLEDIDNVSYPIRELGWEMGIDINPILYTKSEWKKSSYTPFYKNVSSEGIIL